MAVSKYGGELHGEDSVAHIVVSVQGSTLEWPGIEYGLFMVQKQTRCLRGRLQRRAS